MSILLPRVMRSVSTLSLLLSLLRRQACAHSSISYAHCTSASSSSSLNYRFAFNRSRTLHGTSLRLICTLMQ